MDDDGRRVVVALTLKEAYLVLQLLDTVAEAELPGGMAERAARARAEVWCEMRRAGDLTQVPREVV